MNTKHIWLSGYQSQLFPLIQNWLDAGSRAVLSVVHDLGLARRFGSRTLLLHHGRVLADGTKESVFTPANLQKAYGINVEEWMQKLYEPWQEK